MGWIICRKLRKINQGRKNNYGLMPFCLKSTKPQLLYENEKATNKMGLGYGYCNGRANGLAPLGSSIRGLSCDPRRKLFLRLRSCCCACRTCDIARQQMNFYTAILCPSFFRSVICNGSDFAKSQHMHTIERNIVFFG